jgi:carbamoyl-phosphate synthase large subunit
MDRHAVGLFLADAGFIIPPGGAPDFVPTLRRICREEKVEVVVPLVDEELTDFWELAGDGVHIMLPRREFITLCLDKYALAQRLDGCDIRAPRTRLASEGVDAAMRFPLVVKPRTGRGSRGVELLESNEALRSYLGGSPYGEDELILQEYISGPEFTVSVVAWRDGEVQAVVPKEVISKRGITRLAVTRRNERIDRLCRDIQSRLRADGPFNVQLRINENSGEPVPFEINPRFSTTVSLTIAAGVDEVGVLIRQAVSGSNSSHFAQWSEGVVLIRQTLDEFVAESEFQTRNDHICGVKGQ